MEKSLRDLIARLPIPGLKESTNRHVVAEILSKELGIPVKASQINIKDEILSVAVQSVVKSALHIRQKNIFDLLQREGIVVRAFR